MESLVNEIDPGNPGRDCGEPSHELRGLTRSALGPVCGESSSEGGADQDSLNSNEEVPPRNISRTSYVIDDRGDDDIDDEITAVFADGDKSAENDDTMSKSWHGSRSSSQKSLSFFVDLNSSGPPPPLNRSMSHSQAQRRVSSARSRTRTGSCNTSFFIDLNQSASGVRSTSRLENSNQLTQMSTDIKTKSKQLLARNLQQSQTFFTKLKAFIDFLNMPNYSKEEVRQKKILADKITRVMFEEEQRLRRGMDLSEIQQLDKILDIKNIRPTSAYAAMQNTHIGEQSQPHQVKPKLSTTHVEFSSSNESTDKPVLRRERTFNLDSESSIVNKELRAYKKQNRKSMPVNLTVPIIDPGNIPSIEERGKVGWMVDDNKVSSEKEISASADLKTVCDDFNLLQYFQQQRLEHTRLLRNEIQRLESLEKVYLSAIKQPKNKSEEKKNNANKELQEKKVRKVEKKQKVTEDEKKKHKVTDEEECGISRKDTFTKTERRRIAEKLSKSSSHIVGNGQESINNSRTKLLTDAENSSNKEKMTTSFKEVADKKRRNEVSAVLSNSNSPLSWYIPSDPPSRSNSKNSDTSNQISRQNSYEHEYYGYSSPPPVTACMSSQTNLRSRASSVSTNQSQSRNPHVKSRHFGQMYPSRQQSQDSDVPPNQCRGIQTGSSLLRMYLKKVDKGQQLSDRPQAFFLPLDSNAEDRSNLIDLETSGENELTDLQKALRKHRPDYIAAAEERAGRLSRNNEDKKSKDNVMTRSIESQLKKPSQFSTVKRSQSTPRVSSILKFNNTNNSISNGMNALKNGFRKKTDGKAEKKSVTIVQSGEEKKSRNNVTVLKSRSNTAKKQHFNIKNIYAPDAAKSIKSKVY